MQHTQQLFLEALKAALKNEQVEWNNKLEAQEWMDLFRMAEVPQILPMIYEAVTEARPPGRRIRRYWLRQRRRWCAQ